VIFSSNIIETPKSSRDGAKKKTERKEKKERGRERKLQESLQIKGKSIF
jgi:hypothetical protein